MDSKGQPEGQLNHDLDNRQNLIFNLQVHLGSRVVVTDVALAGVRGKEQPGWGAGEQVMWEGGTNRWGEKMRWKGEVKKWGEEMRWESVASDEVKMCGWGEAWWDEAGLKVHSQPN